MISQETAEMIWCAYREIRAAKLVLEDMEKARSDGGEDEEYAATLKDAFGHRRLLQLGVPSGQSGHRLYGVAPRLAESVIKAHIAESEAELVRANERARIELEQD